MRLYAAVLAGLVTVGLVDGAAAQDAAPGWLGVSMDTGAADGVAVKHVVRASPAEKAGLKEGDRIVRIAGQSVTRAAEVTRTVSTRGAGETVTIAVQRGGKEATFKVTLESRPSADEMLRMDHVGSFA